MTAGARAGRTLALPMDSKEELQVEPPPPPRRGGRLPLPRRRRPDPQGLALAPLLKKVRSYNPKGDMRLLERAYRFSEEAHDGQSRLSGAPFIEHPLAVAEILADLRLDTTTLTAALLHDTVEDTDVTLEVITEAVRRRRHADRRRPHEARPAPVPHPRAGAGRERPQDDRGDGRRHPRAVDQAGRPAPQHADGLGARAGEADAHGHRDARDLRAPGEPARRPGGEVGARGPVVQDAPSGPLQGDRAAGRDPPR